MKKVFEILREVQETSSTKGKIAILEANKDNEKLQEVLYYTYNPMLKYGFSAKNITLEKTEDDVAYRDIFSLLDDLSESNINNKLRADVNNFLANCEDWEADLYKRMILKDLKCGITETTVNKVWNKLIPVWSVQKGTTFDKVKLKKDEKFVLQSKENGIRCSFFKGKMLTRAGHEVCGMFHIIADVQSIWGNDFLIDGELIRNNVDNLPDNENFRLTTSIVNSKTEEDKTEIIFKIYDIVPAEEFLANDCKMKYISERMDFIQSFKDEVSISANQSLRILPIDYIGSDVSMIEKLLEEYDSKGLEGVMLYRDVVYQSKRHSGLAKVKSWKYSDCRIVGWYTGELGSKWDNKFGGFTIAFKGNTVDIGGGYTDEEREYYTLNGDNYIGRVLEVKYKEESVDSKTGLPSMQFPVKSMMREVGKEVSYES